MPRKKEIKRGFLSQFNLSESYVSLLLGLGVVALGLFLILSFAKSRQTGQISQESAKDVKTVAQQKQEPTVTPQAAAPSASASVSVAQKPSPIKAPVQMQASAEYTVVPGDTLWSISEKQYKTGYNWTVIARENKIENPNIISVGAKLKLPKEVPKIVAIDDHAASTSKMQESRLITGSSYTVVRGDFLWDIALRAYGDGYRWVEIARANNLANPNIIHSGNVFQIPRK